MIEYQTSFYCHRCDLRTILAEGYLTLDHHDPSFIPAFIEEIVLGFPVRPVFAQELLDGRNIVLNGGNFIHTMREFYNDKRVPNMPDYPELHNQKFSELPYYLQNRIDDVVVGLYLLRHDVSLKIFNNAMFY